MRRNAVARLVAAVALTAAAGIVLPAVSASAAACSSADGVTVVVDYNELGGGVKQVCDSGGGGKSATQLFSGNGFALDYVQRQPGFVCRVNGKPSQAQDPCVNTPPTDAYWGLWWSDGESGDWVYSSESASGLNVPDGGYVAFSWNGSADRSPPGASPSPHEPDPTDDPDPEPPGDGNGGGGNGGGGGGNGGGSGGDKGGGSGGSPTSSPSDSPSGSASAAPGKADKSDKPGKGDKTDKAGTTGDDKTDEDVSASADPAEPESSESTEVAPTAGPPSDAGDDGLPAWVAPVGIGVLFAAAGVVALVRRRATS